MLATVLVYIIGIVCSMSALSVPARAAGFLAASAVNSPPTGDFLNYLILAALLAIGIFILFIITRRNRNR